VIGCWGGKKGHPGGFSGGGFRSRHIEILRGWEDIEEGGKKKSWPSLGGGGNCPKNGVSEGGGI